MRLTEYKTECIAIAKKTFWINPAYDTVLAVQKLYKEDLEDWEKLDQALKMFVINDAGLKRLSWKQKAELLEEIYNKFINDDDKCPIEHDSVPILDFELDSDYIFSSFFLDYGIDLLNERGKMSWERFIALFRGLSDHTKIREVMRIRKMDVPEYNGKNQKKIQDILKLKSYYALPVRNNSGQSGLSDLFDKLEKVAMS